MGKITIQYVEEGDTLCPTQQWTKFRYIRNMDEEGGYKNFYVAAETCPNEKQIKLYCKQAAETNMDIDIQIENNVFDPPKCYTRDEIENRYWYNYRKYRIKQVIYFQYSLIQRINGGQKVLYSIYSRAKEIRDGEETDEDDPDSDEDNYSTDEEGYW